MKNVLLSLFFVIAVLAMTVTPVFAPTAEADVPSEISLVYEPISEEDVEHCIVFGTQENCEKYALPGCSYILKIARINITSVNETYATATVANFPQTFVIPNDDLSTGESFFTYMLISA